MSKTNEILMRRRSMIETIPEEELSERNYEQTEKETAMAFSIMKNMEEYGFCASTQLKDAMLKYSREELVDLYKELEPEMKKLSGADKIYKPMYPNFPEQVMEADDLELFFNAVIHYLSGGELLPEYEKDPRIPLIDDSKLKAVYPGNEEELHDIFNNIATSSTSISVQDKKDLVDMMDDKGYEIPTQIPHKENKAYLTNLIWNRTQDVNKVRPYCETATDILRFAVEMSDGDVTLATKTKFSHMNRPTRRMFADLLNGIKKPQEDMYRNKSAWLRLGEIIHPGEFQKFAEANKAFNTLRNEKKPLFFEGQLNKNLESHEIDKAVTLLKTRPGEFARNLDKLLRDSVSFDGKPNTTVTKQTVQNVLSEFKSVANRVSVPVLFQVREHFIHRNDDEPIRTFMPKGKAAEMIAIENNLDKLPSEICNEIVEICDNAIKEQFAEKNAMGKVYIDPELKGFVIPQSQKSANASNKIVTRGSHLPVDEKAECIRGFIHWTNMSNKGDNKKDNWLYNSRVDLDLSATIYDKDWNYLQHISYTNLRSPRIIKEYEACHSGDIVDGGPANGDGVAEFIDIKIQKDSNVKYVVFQVYSYTGQHYCDMPNASFGYMEREELQSGEIFEPKTVKFNMSLNADNIVSIPAIYDCEKHEMIFCDLGIRAPQRQYGGNNLESNFKGATAACYAMVHNHKPSIYDLIELNAQARGETVTDRNEADIIFSNDETIPVQTMVNEQGEEVEVENTDVPIINGFQVDYFYDMLSSAPKQKEREEPELQIPYASQEMQLHINGVGNNVVPNPLMESLNKQAKNHEEQKEGIEEELIDKKMDAMKYDDEEQEI